MTILSVLDQSPIRTGATPADAVAETLALAELTDRLGYHRYWLAEHHNMRGIASAATSVVIGHVAGGTSKIRVGAGGIMLPNHAPIMVAEQFGTLEALYPGRIDLGLGRAPGTDGMTAQALRRTLHSDPNKFPNDVVELKRQFDEKTLEIEIAVWAQDFDKAEVLQKDLDKLEALPILQYLVLLRTVRTKPHLV